MNLVSWNSAIQIVPRERSVKKNPEYDLWCDIMAPSDHTQLIGNIEPTNQVEEWFKKAKKNTNTSYCLFVHGESGTGKSKTVSIIAKKLGFDTIHTYADKQRTPIRLEGFVREAGIYGKSGVIILDDFEIFLQETTSLKTISKFLGGLVKSGKSKNRYLFVIISNSMHKTFSSIQGLSSDIVKFDKLSQKSMQRIFNRLVLKVRSHSYIPPMAAYFASISCSGSITQGIQQLQFMYYHNKEPKITKRPSKRKKIDNKPVSIKDQNNRDSISFLWCDMYTDKMLDHLTSVNFEMSTIIDRLLGFGKDRLDLLGLQVYKEYPKMIPSSKPGNSEKMSKIIDAMGDADINRIEIHEDGLYDGENKDRWSENDISYIAGITSCIIELKGLSNKMKATSSKRNRHSIKLRKSTIISNPLDSYYATIICDN
jgi:hypothetical protein